MRLKAVYRALLKRLAPCRHMEKVGVNFKRGGVHIYGRVDWSTEPWIIFSW